MGIFSNKMHMHHFMFFSSVYPDSGVKCHILVNLMPNMCILVLKKIAFCLQKMFKWPFWGQNRWSKIFSALRAEGGLIFGFLLEPPRGGSYFGGGSFLGGVLGSSRWGLVGRAGWVGLAFLNMRHWCKHLAHGYAGSVDAQLRVPM